MDKKDLPVSEIYLTSSEHWFLFKTKWLGYKPTFEDISKQAILMDMGLICAIPIGYIGETAVIRYKTTKKYDRWRVYERRQFRKSYITPVVVSIVTTLATMTLKELLSPKLTLELANWLRGLV